MKCKTSYTTLLVALSFSLAAVANEIGDSSEYAGSSGARC